MRLSRMFLLPLVLALAACETTPAAPPIPEAAASASAALPRQSPQQAARTFNRVVQTVEPVAERECRQRTRGVNCDFKIVVDPRRDAPANAFQSLEADGRPRITFTVAMIAEVRNEDELAFVLGHEAAHHVAGHLAKQAESAAAGAVIFAGLATLTGGTATDVQAAQEIGAVLGSRTYSKEFELEADRLGTIIAYRAGYDPMKGAQFFARIPDPGNRFLGTHPPNAQRFDVVRETMASIN